MRAHATSCATLSDPLVVVVVVVDIDIGVDGVGGGGGIVFVVVVVVDDDVVAWQQSGRTRAARASRRDRSGADGATAARGAAGDARCGVDGRATAEDASLKPEAELQVARLSGAARRT